MVREHKVFKNKESKMHSQCFITTQTNICEFVETYDVIFQSDIQQYFMLYENE